MLIFRWVLMLLLVAAAVCFAMYAGTRQVKYRRFGLAILMWMVIAGLGFFAVLFVQQLG